MTLSAPSLSLHLSLTPQLLGWKELPPEDPLVSAYVKVLGQEIASVDIDKDAIQQIMMVLTRLLPFLSVMLSNFPSLCLLTYLPNLFLFSESHWIIKLAASGEKSGGRGPARYFRPMDPASSGGRAAAHCPHGGRCAAGAQPVRCCAGPGCG